MTATAATCMVVLLASASAHRHGAPEVALVAIAMHESRLHERAVGDAGLAIGPWQIHTGAHAVRCRTLACQADYAARMLAGLRARRGSLREAIQGWNPRSVGYAERVMSRLHAAERLIAECTAEYTLEGEEPHGDDHESLAGSAAGPGCCVVPEWAE